MPTCFIRWRALARRGAIIEIGSAGGTVDRILSRWHEKGPPESGFAIDPHTGDERFLAGTGPPPPPSKSVLGWRRGSGHDDDSGPQHFSSLDEFLANLRRYGLIDRVEPVVATSTEAAISTETGPMQLARYQRLGALDDKAVSGCVQHMDKIERRLPPSSSG